MAATRKIFVNLPVQNLEKSKEFFTALGFSFNPQFTNDKGACMVLSEEGFVMLLQEEFFASFTQRKVAEEREQTAVIVALSSESREDVDQLLQKALAAGGSAAMPAVDHGFMYSTSFYDLDGHHWEVVWMDPAAMQG